MNAKLPRTDQAAREIAEGHRFAFGANWQRFLASINQARIDVAIHSLTSRLGEDDLAGKTFLDIGCGSGLSSLAARKLNARVTSFDFDGTSVACTKELKRRYFDADDTWRIEQGSALDQGYLKSLGKYDVVYSWGVLHHTGHMWEALDNAAQSVADGGKLFIALYNDQGRKSKLWLWTKRAYNRSFQPLRGMILITCLMGLWGPSTIRDFLIGKPFRTWMEYSKNRGMSPFWDIVDWVGGYPFEVSTPAEIFDFYRKRGFALETLTTCAGRHGCNEFVFRKL